MYMCVSNLAVIVCSFPSKEYVRQEYFAHLNQKWNSEKRERHSPNPTPPYALNFDLPIPVSLAVSLQFKAILASIYKLLGSRSLEMSLKEHIKIYGWLFTKHYFYAGLKLLTSAGAKQQFSPSSLATFSPSLEGRSAITTLAPRRASL